MTGVVLPKINNNDARYLLLEWVAKDGSTVRPGDVLALIETSKTVEELTAEDAGVLRHLAAEGTECEPGQTIARLGDDATPASEPAPVPGTPADVIITAPARRLMAELGIDEDGVRALGLRVIRRTDVEAMAMPTPPRERPDAEKPAPPPRQRPAVEELTPPPREWPAEQEPAPPSREWPAEEELTMPRTQQRIADVVSRTHREVPAAYTLVKVDVEEALALARAETRRLRTLVGLPELLVKAVAGLIGRFEVLYATPVGPGRLRRAATAHVGVTMDAGKGLYVPVVHDATHRPLADISRTLMRHRVAAMRGGLREEDLSGANIAVTLHNEGAVTLAIPIVFPGHICALSLAAPQREAVPVGDGFEARHTVHLGLAYDHRYANGHDAVQFLEAIRTALESPAPLAEETP